MSRIKNTALVLFLINPFAGFIHGFLFSHEKWSKNAVWLFVIFYGFTMVKPDGMDSARYVQKLQTNYYGTDWQSFKDGFYSATGEQVDIYEPTIVFFISRITDSGDALFAVFGLVFGFFYSRNLWMVLRYKPGPLSSYSWLLFL
ncbi:MAG: hypothetical protein RIB86_00280, partial [Imperialibacter sp.]